MAEENGGNQRQVSGNAEMAGEVEQYLLDKIMRAIEEAESAEKHLLVKLVPLRSQFQDLKKLLAPSPPADGSKLSREKLYYLDNLLTEWLMLSKKQSSCSPQALNFAINLNSSLKKIKKELILGDANGAPNRTIIPQPTGEASPPKKLETYRWSTRSVDTSKVHGLDDEVMSLERLLVLRRQSVDQFKAIGIVGMGGIGKTTLCQVLFTKQELKNHFLPRIWVCLSKQPKEDEDNRKEIVTRMLICLGVEEEIIKSAWDNHGLNGLLSALHLQLMGKRYLIVLDDAWSTDDCFKNLDSCLTINDENRGEKLALGLPKGHGGTVIVTSRSEEVAKNMVGEENLLRLRPVRDPKSCWLIFKDSVEKDGIKFPQDLENLENLESIKAEIVKKCAGLPLAAKMMGQIKHEQLQQEAAASESQPDGNHQALQQSTC